MQPAFKVRLRNTCAAFKAADFRILRQDSLADPDALTGLGPDGRRLSSEPGIQRTGRRSSLRHCPPNRILASPLVRDGPLSAPCLHIHQTTRNRRMAPCPSSLDASIRSRLLPDFHGCTSVSMIVAGAGFDPVGNRSTEFTSVKLFSNHLHVPTVFVASVDVLFEFSSRQTGIAAHFRINRSLASMHSGMGANPFYLLRKALKHWLHL